ncbi:MAG: hypothetical protein A2X85_16260 [Geobacteraceae bacterium GWF2_54_21]|nr:MAG: hypothetical protein A2X85_16260 [Geobacteraceae bacterium GWF2_54_21]HBA70863.1 chemotaxis protein CheD [Geobacter sp.]
MKDLITSHIHNIYLKPGEVVVTLKPVLVSTVLGSCVAVTLFSPDRGFGAICHAMLPNASGQSKDMRYVDAALLYIYRKAQECGASQKLVVKLFGGARVLNVGSAESTGYSVGEQNVARALEVIASLGLSVAGGDTGGLVGRKLFFCTRDGDVYLRKMRRIG